MSITFKRVTQEFDDHIPDGDYPVEIQKIEKKLTDWGEQIAVTNLIIGPEAYKGRFLWKNFNIGSDIPEYKEKAEKQFNKFWSEMTDDEDGKKITDEDLQKLDFTEAIAKVKNFPQSDGKMKAYIVGYTRINKDKSALIMPPQKDSSTFKEVLDDDLPF